MKRGVFSRLFSLGDRKLRPYIVGLVGCMLSSAAYDLALAMLLRSAFDRMANRDLSGLLRGTATYGGLVLLLSLVMALFSFVYSSSAASITAEIRKAVFAHTQNLPLSYLTRVHSGDLLSRINSDIAQAEPMYGSIPRDMTSGAASALVGVVYLTLIDWRLTAYALAVASLSVLVNIVFTKPLRELTRQVQERLASLSQDLSDLLSGISLVRTFNLTEALEGKYVEKNSDYYAAAMCRVRRNAVVTLAGDFTFFATQMGLIAVACYFAIRGFIDIGAVIAAFGMIGPIIRFFSALARNSAGLQRALAAENGFWRSSMNRLNPGAWRLRSHTGKGSSSWRT